MQPHSVYEMADSLFADCISGWENTMQIEIEHDEMGINVKWWRWKKYEVQKNYFGHFDRINDA